MGLPVYHTRTSIPTVVDTVTEELATYEIADADYKFSTARNGAWTMLTLLFA